MEPREAHEINPSQPSAAGVGAAQGDTNITVNQSAPRPVQPQAPQQPGQPAAPNLVIPTRPRPTPAPAPQPEPQVAQQPQPAQPQRPYNPVHEPTAPARGNRVPPPSAPRAPQPQPQSSQPPRPPRDYPRTDVRDPQLPPAAAQPRQAAPLSRVNWGGVLKTALIVAAVGLVAFAAAAFLSGFVGYMIAAAVTVPAVAATVNGTASVIGPIGAGLANGVAWLGGVISAGFAGLLSGLGVSGTAAGVGAAGAGAVAAAPVVDPATLAGLSNGAKAAAIGGAAAVSVPIVHKMMASTPMIDPNAHAAAAATGQEHAAAAATAGKKATVTAQAAPTEQLDLRDRNPGVDLPDMPDELTATQTTAKHATKMAQHASHADEHRPANSALRQTARTSEAWAERVSTAEKPTYSRTLAETGSHGEAIRAGGKTERRVEPRSSEFATQMTQDRAALDAALGEPAR